MHVRRTAQWISMIAMLLTASVFADEQALVTQSNVAGKKLIRVAQEVFYSHHFSAQDVAGRIDSWQQTGYDGTVFNIEIDPAAMDPAPAANFNSSMLWRWWGVAARSHKELERDIKAYKSVKDWGRFTDNFLWMASHVEGDKPPNWFSDADWKIVLDNARLGAKIAKEIGFKGISFDAEGYGGGTYGVWRQPWDYSLYARSDYTIEERDKPRSFKEVSAKVRQRGKQWAQAISEEYPDMVLAVLPGLYEVSWMRANEPRFGGDLAKTDIGLWPSFVDGMLQGLGEKVLLVDMCEATYLDSHYREMLVVRDFAKQQALAISAVPELARQRISFAAGIWTDAGFGTPRFSKTDERYNQRDPERHQHAVHSALAASDHYAWQWGEWGKAGESNFLTTDPTPLMRKYWQANIDARTPQYLKWEIVPYLDQTDYTATNADAVSKGQAFWKNMESQGYTVAVALDEYWKFRFDPEMKVRYSEWMSADFNDSSWFTIKSTQCWQLQGTNANGPGVYRIAFDVPKNVDPAKQEVVLAFGGLGSGAGHLYFNSGWIDWLKQTIDVSKVIKPGEKNYATIVCLNKTGPGGLMGPVKLLVRDRK